MLADVLVLAVLGLVCIAVPDLRRGFLTDFGRFDPRRLVGGPPNPHRLTHGVVVATVVGASLLGLLSFSLTFGAAPTFSDVFGGATVRETVTCRSARAQLRTSLTRRIHDGVGLCQPHQEYRLVGGRPVCAPRADGVAARKTDAARCIYGGRVSLDEHGALNCDVHGADATEWRHE